VDLNTITGAVDNIVTSTAVVIGGIWAYFKFIRGRTFAHRAELDVSLSLERTVGPTYLCAIVTVKNTGLSKLPLNKDLKAIRLLGVATTVDSHLVAVKWERIATLPLLEHTGGWKRKKP
jgi:hypothetical protein